MPGYQRFVTYMFRYKDEKKQENCGFAKIEIRQGHCRVQIQITGMKGSEAEVYFLSKDAYVPVGIYLESCGFRRELPASFSCAMRIMSGRRHIPCRKCEVSISVSRKSRADSLPVSGMMSERCGGI